MKLIIKKDYQDPENNFLEIVERKGVGHPDTLADKLAEECSRVYSEYCIKEFGFVLHHNLDKLYIGAGLFLLEKAQIICKNKIRIDLNGRCSNQFGNKKIDLEALFTPIIKSYISSVMPRINPDNDLAININCTQFSKRENWYTPKSISDVPDAKELFAADTSLCIAYLGHTFCEKLALELEGFFYTHNELGYPTPNFKDIGQDIKIMVSRISSEITVTMCLPVFKDKYKSESEYVEIIKKYELLLTKKAETIENPRNYTFKIEINRLPDYSYRNYSLLKGSCIECGEEGVVGRGNNAQGLISTFRHHTMEAACGKNVRYHTGRVVSFMQNETIKKLHEQLGVNAMIYCLTRNRGSIFEPFVFYLSVDNEVKREDVEKIIKSEFNEKFLEKIIERKNLI